jgi:hypothetical protein
MEQSTISDQRLVISNQQLAISKEERHLLLLSNEKATRNFFGQLVSFFSRKGHGKTF